MSHEEILFELTKVALNAVIRNHGSDLMNKDFSQTHLGRAASNVAKAAYDQMLVNLKEFYE